MQTSVCDDIYDDVGRRQEIKIFSGLQNGKLALLCSDWGLAVTFQTPLQARCLIFAETVADFALRRRLCHWLSPR